MEASINSKALRGIKAFLTRRNFDIIEEGWAHGKDTIDFIAREDDELVFIEAVIRENTGTGLGSEASNRAKMERIAAAYLADHLETPEGTVRFDVCTILILGDSKALIRHHRNALSDSGTTEV